MGIALRFRWSALFCLVMTVCLCVGNAPCSGQLPLETVTATDKKVYEAMLNALSAKNSDGGRMFSRGGYLMDQTGDYGCDPGKLTKVVGAKATSEVETNMECRNQLQVSMRGYAPPKYHLFSDEDLRKLRAEEDRVGRDQLTPGYNIILWLALPGYSHDKHTALVSFRFDDGGRHGGGGGCCVMQLRSGRWKLRWKYVGFRA